MSKRSLPGLIAAMWLLAAPVTGAGNDKWYEARSANFIVVSNAGESEARKVAVQFEQIRSLFRDSLSYARAHVSPLITILAVKDEDSLSELLPEFWEKGHAHPSGLFADSGLQFQVAVNLSAQGENPYVAIYHEYYHSVTTPYLRGLPTWLAEGLANFYGNSTIGAKDASLGMPDRGLIQQLRTQPLIPLATLFKVDHSSPYYNEEGKTSVFYAESWALAHYLMVGDKQSHRPALTAYLDELSHGATPDQAAAKAFGDLDKLESSLQAYVRGSAFTYLVVPAPPKVAESELHTQLLTDAQADAYRGGFLTAHRQFKYAQPLLDQASRLDPKLALAQENLALLYYFQQRRSEALTALSSAIALNPRNSMTRFLRANLNITGNGASAQDPQSEQDLRQAIAIDPNFAGSYALLASYLATQNEKLPEALDFALKSVSLEPGRTNYQYTVAQVLARMGRYDEAEAVARQVRMVAADARERETMDRFSDYLQKAREADARRSAAGARLEGAASSPGPADDPGEPKIVSRHRVGRAEGVVTQVRCNKAEMLLTLKTSDGALELRAADFTQIQFTSSEGLDSSPCDSLKGLTVRVLTRDTSYPGEIVQIDLLNEK